MVSKSGDSKIESHLYVQDYNFDRGSNVRENYFEKKNLPQSVWSKTKQHYTFKWEYLEHLVLKSSDWKIHSHLNLHDYNFEEGSNTIENHFKDQNLLKAAWSKTKLNYTYKHEYLKILVSKPDDSKVLSQLYI